MQVTTKVPETANRLLQGIPTTVDVKGLELNITLAGESRPTQHVFAATRVTLLVHRFATCVSPDPVESLV